MNRLNFILDRTVRPLSLESIWFLVAGILFLLLASVVYRSYVRHTPYRYYSLFILFYVSFRILILENPLFFTTSYFLLSTKDISIRQKDDLRAYVSKDWNLNAAPYLAIGSSQTGALYGALAQEHPDIDTFALSGMGPLDLNLYADQIIARAPRHIILTLSDFDIGRKPSATTIKTGPRQSIEDLMELLQIWSSDGLFSGAQISDFLATQFITEYRFQFIFKGLVRKLCLRQLVSKPPQVEDRTSRQKKALAGLTSKWFDINELFIRRFLDRIEAAGIESTIVEGHYDPAMLSMNSELHKTAMARIARISADYNHTRFIPLEELPDITAEDYRDPYHIRRESGLTISKAIMKAIQDTP